MRILDAGCGYGRNLVHLLREGCEVFALDADPSAVEHVRQLSASLETGLPPENFQTGRIDRMPFPDAFADVVLCNSVLHFSRDEEHFEAMLTELWRTVKPGGQSSGAKIGQTGCLVNPETESLPFCADRVNFPSIRNSFVLRFKMRRLSQEGRRRILETVCINFFSPPCSSAQAPASPHRTLCRP